MKKENFDIHKLTGSGYVIFPLSISRLSTGQSSEVIYDFLKFLEQKIESISNDVILLYTDGLYLNNEDRALDLRKKILNQMLNHKDNFLNLVYKDKKYVPKAFHFINWDYIILNADKFQESKRILINASVKDVKFRESLLIDLKSQEREESEANINFLIEEIVVTYLITQKEILLPYTLTSENGWRLICYPGNPINSLVYIYKNKVLKTKKFENKQDDLFSHSFYNMEKKVLIDFDVE